MIRVPEGAGQERDDIFHNAVIERYNNRLIEWSEVQCSAGEHTGTLYVTSDAVAVRGLWMPDETCDCGLHKGVLYLPSDPRELQQCPESYRIDVTPRLSQHICDMCGTLLATTKIADMIYAQRAVKLPCYTSSPDAQMASTARMVWHSDKIKAGKGDQTGLTCNVGKYWVFTNTLLQHPGMAANYGWYDTSAPYWSYTHLYKLWQPLSWAHNLEHTDYSQTLVLVGSQMIVDGSPMNTWEVLKDPELCALLSYEGVLQIDRIPGVDPDPDSGCDLISPAA